MFESIFPRSLRRKAARRARRLTTSRRLAMESLESRTLLTAVTTVEMFSDVDHGQRNHGQRPPEPPGEHASRSKPQAGHDIQLPRPDRNTSQPNTQDRSPRPPHDHDRPSQPKDRRGERSSRPPSHARDPLSSSNATDSLFVAFAQPLLPAVTSAAGSLTPPPVPFASPEQLNAALASRPAPNSIASPSPGPPSPLTTTSLASSAIVSTLPLGGESANHPVGSLVLPATVSFLPVLRATPDATLDASNAASHTRPPVARVLPSDSLIQPGASTQAVEVSIASSEINEATRELPFEDTSRTTQLDRIDDWNIATWATIQRHDILMAIGKQVSDGMSAIWSSGWMHRLSPEATMASDRMIDIGDLYDAPFAIDSHRTNTRLARAEQPGDKQTRDKQNTTLVSLRQSIDATLKRLETAELTSPAEDDDDEDDTPIETTDDSDAIPVVWDEALSIAANGMIEMSHEDNWSPPAPADADTPTSSTADTDWCPVEHGSYVKTDGGAARYQAFEIGTSVVEPLIAANVKK